MSWCLLRRLCHRQCLIAGTRLASLQLSLQNQAIRYAEVATQRLPTSVRFEYWWAKNRPPGYIHPERVASLPGDTDLWELFQDLDYLQPVDDAILAAVSTAKEALQRLLPP